MYQIWYYDIHISLFCLNVQLKKKKKVFLTIIIYVRLYRVKMFFSCSCYNKNRIYKKCWWIGIIKWKAFYWHWHTCIAKEPHISTAESITAFGPSMSCYYETLGLALSTSDWYSNADLAAAYYLFPNQTHSLLCVSKLLFLLWENWAVTLWSPSTTVSEHSGERGSHNLRFI